MNLQATLNSKCKTVKYLQGNNNCILPNPTSFLMDVSYVHSSKLLYRALKSQAKAPQRQSWGWMSQLVHHTLQPLQSSYVAPVTVSPMWNQKQGDKHAEGTDLWHCGHILKFSNCLIAHKCLLRSQQVSVLRWTNWLMLSHGCLP